MKVYKINENWSKYDQTVAESQLDNYGWIYIDKYGCPIDDIDITEDLYKSDCVMSEVYDR